MDMEIAGKGAAGLPSSLPLLERLTVSLFTAGQYGGGGGRKIGVMKFMAAQPLARGCQQRLLLRLRFAVAEPGQTRPHSAVSRNNIRHGVALAAGDFQGRAQVHQAAALGVDRHPAPVRRAKLRQHLVVSG